MTTANLPRRSTWIDRDAGSLGTLPIDARLALGALIANDGSAALGVRQGVFYDGVATAVIVGTTDTGTMTYQIRPCKIACYLLGTAASGIVTIPVDANTKVTTTAAPGSNSRIDVIWVRQQAVASDGGADSVNLPILGCTQGTPAASPTVPAIPTGAYALAQAVVTAGTTQTSTVTITQVHTWTTGAGSPIPFRTSTERDLLADFSGMAGYRLDNQNWELSDGSVWRPMPFAVASGVINVSATALAAGTMIVAASPTFPAGRFTQAPLVQVCLQNGTSGSASATARAGAITTSGFSIVIANTHPSSAMTFAATPCAWTATQMLSGNASG